MASRNRVRRVVAALLLVASGGLLAWTTVRAVHGESINAAPPVMPAPDAAVQATRLLEVLGAYATGNQPGDRVIVVQPDGQIVFHPLGPLQQALEVKDTFQLGKRDTQTLLVTAHSGAIEVIDIDQLQYCGDTYVRTKKK